LAGLPKELIENPKAANATETVGVGDVLSDVLRTIRLSGSIQFCFMPSGAWQTGKASSLSSLARGPSSPIPFHIVVEGTCWMRMEGREYILVAGDVVAFPFGTSHDLGAGSGGRVIIPTADLPPKPWRELPVLRYGEDNRRVRLLCGYLQCDALNFRPLRDALPTLLHARTKGADDAEWLRATIAQIVAEADRPRAGGLSMLERLTETTFIELLRHQIIAARPESVGWLAALADPALSRCLALIHDDPARGWSVPMLAAASGLSRSTLTERFETVLDTSPMRYVRDWRLCLASIALTTTSKGIATIADDAGYGTEAAFNRAFARAYGSPPAAWRQNVRRAQANGAKGR
jgi:AraC-like DNA-binding protein